MEQHDILPLLPDPLAKNAPWFRIYTLGRFQVDWVDPHYLLIKAVGRFCTPSFLKQRDGEMESFLLLCCIV